MNLNFEQFFLDKSGLNFSTASLDKIIQGLTKPIVFTNGVFDILHKGHLSYLIESKKLGASLIVGINSNESSKKLNKKFNRPINDERDRAELVSSLKPVDLCIIFNEETPENLIKKLHPQIYTKGNDYNFNKLPYHKTLAHLKIKTYFIPLIKNKSSTSIIKKIKDAI